MSAATSHGYETSIQGNVAQPDNHLEVAGPYANVASERAGSVFRGLCASCRISDRCFQALLDDGWDHPDQLRDLTAEWRERVLALAPNGGQRRNLERLLDQVQVGHLGGGPAADGGVARAEAPGRGQESNAGGWGGHADMDSGLGGSASASPHSATTQAGAASAAAAGSQREGPGSWRGIMWTGVGQFCLGILIASMGGVLLGAVNGIRYNVGAPIWCGLPLVSFAGFFGMVSGYKKSTGMAIAYLVMSIFACLGDIAVLGLSATGLAVQSVVCDETDSDFSLDECLEMGNGTAVYITLIILTLLEFFVAVFGASLTCTPVCQNEPAEKTSIKYDAEQLFVVSDHSRSAFGHQPRVVSPDQALSAFPSQQSQVHQTRAPPTGEQQYQELIR